MRYTDIIYSSSTTNVIGEKGSFIDMILIHRLITFLILNSLFVILSAGSSYAEERFDWSSFTDVEKGIEVVYAISIFDDYTFTARRDETGKCTLALTNSENRVVSYALDEDCDGLFEDQVHYSNRDFSWNEYVPSANSQIAEQFEDAAMRFFANVQSGEDRVPPLTLFRDDPIFGRHIKEVDLGTSDAGGAFSSVLRHQQGRLVRVGEHVVEQHVDLMEMTLSGGVTRCGYRHEFRQNIPNIRMPYNDLPEDRMNQYTQFLGLAQGWNVTLWEPPFRRTTGQQQSNTFERIQEYFSVLFPWNESAQSSGVVDINTDCAGNVMSAVFSDKNRRLVVEMDEGDAAPLDAHITLSSENQDPFAVGTPATRAIENLAGNQIMNFHIWAGTATLLIHPLIPSSPR